MKNQYVKIVINIAIYFLIGVACAYASSNPLDSIKTNLDTTTDTLISIVQIMAVVAIVLYGAYCMFSGHLDKTKFIMLIIAILIISGAKSFVELLQDWVE
ncbi:TrbC/VIRB2 family protein [Candidatus Hepatincola sp. Av]